MIGSNNNSKAYKIDYQIIGYALQDEFEYYLGLNDFFCCSEIDGGTMIFVNEEQAKLYCSAKSFGCNIKVSLAFRKIKIPNNKTRR